MISDQWQTQHKASATGYLQFYFEGIHSAHFLLQQCWRRANEATSLRRTVLFVFCRARPCPNIARIRTYTTSLHSNLVQLRPKTATQKHWCYNHGKRPLLLKKSHSHSHHLRYLLTVSVSCPSKWSWTSHWSHWVLQWVCSLCDKHGRALNYYHFLINSLEVNASAW